MPRQKERKSWDEWQEEAKYKIRFGDTMKALSPEFDRAQKPLKLKKQTTKMKKPTHRSVVVSKPTLLYKADEPSLKKTTKVKLSRHRNFRKLPTSISGGENIDVKKIFQDEDTGKPRLFHGIVTAHNAKHDFYKVSYEDGDEEEVTRTELEKILARKMSGITDKRRRSKAKKTHSILEKV